MSKKAVKKKFKKTKPKKKESVVKLPSTSKDYSSNWQKISAQISKKSDVKKKLSIKKLKGKTGYNTAKDVPKVKPELWFDDVDMELIDPEDRPDEACVSSTDNADYITTEHSDEKNDSQKSLVKDKSFEGLTKIVGMDCEMVGVGFGGSRSILARVSIVNHFGKTIYDKYVKPTEKVTDYRTEVSGIRPQDVVKGEEFKVVQDEVSTIIKDRILVGHAIKHDLKVLYLSHPKKCIRDTSFYKPFRKAFNGKTPSLKKLTAKFLSVKVQEGEHSPVEDARAAVRLYTMHRTEWEKSLKKEKPSTKKSSNVSTKNSCSDRSAYIDSGSDSDD